MIARKFDTGTVDRAAPDWECPFGVGPVGAKVAQSKGLGDTIAKITKAVGIKPCGGCAERQEALNALLPYKSPDLPTQGQ
jgi:deoxyribose-phosphate aldolase